MKSLDELRKFYEKADGYEMWTPKHKVELDSIADRIEAELAERYVALPIDADGVPIRVGDEMACINNGEHCPVEYIVLTEDGWEVDGESPASMRHYYTPTVEDMLREFALKVAGKECITMRQSVVDEYAAKLRLVGEE